MEITLKPELMEFISDKITQGKYQTLNEAINKGIELLKFQEEIYQGRFEELQKEIIIGVEASERGEVIDSEVLFSQLENKLKEKTIKENNG
jgi:antitoxin ParD1/3/4